MATVKLLPSIESALRSAGIDPYAPVRKSTELRRKAEQIGKEAHAMLDRIPVGQPIGSTRDRNLREKSYEKMKKAYELRIEADALDANNPWHDAILGECMAVECCYDKSDPIKTIKCLIDWHVQNERDQH